MAFEWSVFPDDLFVATAVVVPRGSWLLLPIQRKAEYCLNIGGVKIAAPYRKFSSTVKIKPSLLFPNQDEYITYKPRHHNVVCATSQASDQAAHTRSLIRAFASRLNIL